MKKSRYCECKSSCKKKLDGFYGNRKIHPHCKPGYEKRKRTEKKLTEQKEHSDFLNDFRVEFRNFHLSHIFVRDDIIDMARSLKSNGYDLYGIKPIYETLRWKYKKEGRKINLKNNYTPLYADLVMEKAKDLEGFFVTHPRKKS